MGAGATSASGGQGFTLSCHRAVPLAEGEREARRFLRRFGLVQSVASLVGAFDVFVLLLWILPSPAVPAALEDDLNRLTVAFFAAGLPILMVLANWWGWRLAAPLRRALAADAPPDPPTRAAVLRYPLTTAAMDAAIWALGSLGALVAFSVVISLEMAVHVASVIAMGGLTTVAVTYLLGERMMRPVIARALSFDPPQAPVGPGVRGRLVLAWLLATGVPLAGLAWIGLVAMFEPGVSEEQVATSVLALAAAAGASGLIATVLVAKSVAEPLTSVRRALARIEAGDLDARVEINDVSEVGLLQSGFNEMAVGLRDRERLRDLFGRHVGEDVARQAMQTGEQIVLGGEVRDVAVLFIDLLGSTSMAASQPPGEVVATLNRFFSVVVVEVGRHGGFVNKFEGDGALCVFGAPVDHEEAPGAALAAARALRHRLDRDLPELDAAMGLSCGPAVAGNVGAEHRFEYTVIGDPVNEAARLCEIAKRRPERTVACRTMLQDVGDEEARFWRTGEELTLRGRPAPTQLALPA
jgi:adenylate cyclase